MRLRQSAECGARRQCPNIPMFRVDDGVTRICRDTWKLGAHYVQTTASSESLGWFDRTIGGSLRYTLFRFLGERYEDWTACLEDWVGSNSDQGYLAGARVSRSVVVRGRWTEAIISRVRRTSRRVVITGIVVVDCRFAGQGSLLSLPLQHWALPLLIM